MVRSRGYAMLGSAPFGVRPTRSSPTGAREAFKVHRAILYSHRETDCAACVSHNRSSSSCCVRLPQHQPIVIAGVESDIRRVIRRTIMTRSGLRTTDSKVGTG